ncbi:ubiquitin-conjugating enzyme E2 [Aspergillus vadensis CBS 113365]|uniref:UBC-like protein n=1 Tax=Aspergillus vadensis (strain CBS 113365 / IMI 142717 / IBT 24658) TaxID=1448311 RepID=A0A319B8P3_ASPVC|nr:UBC-like protein [Aspergillus vadensis CBS 113365]PYH66760.1 UBC-like protein [Aspergillus vadensis CBS 113365]
MSPSTRRLLKESTDLQTNPSPYFHAAPVSDSNLFDWHFTLLGPPPPSPYAGGIYHGRITLPPTYPLRPPSFRFLTPSGRFEVNREICLSISGHHEETWQPAWGIRTALIALRSFMDGDAKGQVGGLDDFGGEEMKGEEDKVVVDEGEAAAADAGISADVDTSQVRVPQAEVQPQPQPQQPQQQQLQHTPPATRPPAPPVPAAAAAAAATSQDTPWLDRAIIGVIIALVAMILRRLTRDMDLE